MRRSSALLVLGAAALTVASLFGSRPFVPIGFGLLAAGTAARVWVVLVGRRVRVSRSVPLERPLEGSTVRIVYRVDGLRPLLLGRAVAREQVEGRGALEARLTDGEGALELRRAPRGRYRVAESEVALEDHLGVERVIVRPPSLQPVLVYPRLPELDALFTDAARRGGGQRNAPLRSGGFDFHSVREYEHGESLRTVHWPTTARLGRLMVKELREAPRDDVLVVLQCERGTVVGPRGHSSFDAQVRAAGSLLRALVARGRRASFVLGTDPTQTFRVTSLEGDWDAAYAALAAVEADGEAPLEQLLRDPAVSRAGELLLVVAQLSPQAVDRLLVHDPRRLAVVLVDPASFGAQRAVRGSDPGLLRLAAAGVPVAVVRSGDDLTRVLGGDLQGRVSA